ncbi:SDR family NAD(P)-dependent oxidoreductase [Aeromicrobium sp. 50.2.37]|uniref:SDR family NAD(P)-dependent oxidoreductase n=1 Tax=Aeromicrobium sp. 50.2.37 TaxID=2969305 RepID=UPI00215007C0|nr:SDR family oxidoreductase [Aeromicrobium sp. 50.2.37]MCR4512640.1 SDR family oxidoreductase [Aeromicrobium sp. 50.2.37]
MTTATQGFVDEFDLTGRRALVTGASRGIGRAIAIAFARRGASVLGVARSAESLAETMAAAEDLPGRIEVLVADLRSPDSICEAVETANTRLGGLDILVNNAADDHESRIEDTELSTWQRVLELNLQSCFLLTQAASPYLKADDGGKVINVSSMLGTVAVREDVAYVSAKHGLIGLTRATALEWARKNVQVNALAPGFVETEMLAPSLADPDVAAYMRRLTPAGRIAQPEEIASAAVFLASAGSDFMTGQTLVVDGGYTAQ